MADVSQDDQRLPSTSRMGGAAVGEASGLDVEVGCVFGGPFSTEIHSGPPKVLLDLPRRRAP
jgi:hypothetical protein